jgi:hypothetical protein
MQAPAAQPLPGAASAPVKPAFMRSVLTNWRRLGLRSWHLLVISILLASAQTYDWPGAIAPYLKRELGITGEQLGALYSAYHAPNLVVVILGGILIDVVGPDLASVGFTGVIVLASVVLASGASFVRMLISRVLLGVGGESTNVAQLALLNRAFDSGGSGRRPDCVAEFPSIAVAYAVSTVVVRLTTLAMLYTLPGLVATHGWVGLHLLTGLSALSFLFSFVLLGMERGYIGCCDVRADIGAGSGPSGHEGGQAAAADVPQKGETIAGAPGRQDLLSKTSSGTMQPWRVTAQDTNSQQGDGVTVLVAAPDASGLLASAENAADDEPGDGEDQPLLPAASANANATNAPPPSTGAVRDSACILNSVLPASGLPSTSGTRSVAAAGMQQRHVNQGPSAPGVAAGKPSGDSGPPPAPPSSFWAWLNCCSERFCSLPLLVNALFTLLFTASVLPFGEISTALFNGVYGYDEVAAARVSSIQVIVSLCCMIPYGLALDYKLLRYHTALLIGCVTIAPAWALLACAARVPPEVAAALAGVGGAAVNTAVWPLIGFRLPQEVQGRVLGLLTAAQNGVMVASPLIVGVLRDRAAASAAARGLEGDAHSYGPAMWYLFAGVVVCVGLALWLAALDGWAEPTHLQHLSPDSKLNALPHPLEAGPALAEQGASGSDGGAGSAAGGHSGAGNAPATAGADKKRE